MSYQCKLGVSAWDAVAYVRAKTEDTATPFIIPDSSYQAYAEAVAEEFSRYASLDEQVGDPYAVTSPLLTVRGKQRYVCSVGNGFAVPPSQINDVLYQATSVFSASSEISYLALLPFSPVNRFLFTPNLLDSPSERVMRDEYLGELDHYGKGWAGVVRDRATGLLAIDLYPIPGQDGSPIFVRYSAGHVNVPSGGNDVYVTIPDAYKYLFAKLLWAEVLETEAERYAKVQSAAGGLIRRVSNSDALMQKVFDLRAEVHLALGEAVPTVQVAQ